MTVELNRVGPDDWETIIESPPGLYHVNIRVDAGTWTVPPGSAAVPDRFGGTTGLLELPPFQGEGNHEGDGS